jgi:hypothetical protein
MTLSERRFWEHVVKTETCWIWTGLVAKRYPKHGGTTGHRYAYRLLVGPIPSGFHVDHLCRNPMCVNPDHLEPVTPQENKRRETESRTHCKNGHRFTPESTYLHKGYIRQCRPCDAATSRAYRSRKKARQ